MFFSTYVISTNLALNIGVVLLSLIVISFFYRRGASCYIDVKERIKQETNFFHEILLGLESAGQSLSPPNLLERETRIAIWELYNHLRVQTSRESKSIVLQRKMLEKKQEIFRLLEEGKVNLEVLPFLGIIGTLLGFAAPQIINLSGSAKVNFDVTSLGFFLAISSTVCALVALIYLKKTYEAKTMADFDYYIQQQHSVEKIMLEYDGFKYLSEWLRSWSQGEKNLAETLRIERDSLEGEIDEEFYNDIPNQYPRQPKSFSDKSTKPQDPGKSQRITNAGVNEEKNQEDKAQNEKAQQETKSQEQEEEDFSQEQQVGSQEDLEKELDTAEKKE